ncbi:MAG: hypothetical protein KDE69_07125, partial [Burkholderiaceae bacterium]|nr:hypothetical protein [Burkholderiaceae bacterium]
MGTAPSGVAVPPQSHAQIRRSESPRLNQLLLSFEFSLKGFVMHSLVRDEKDETLNGYLNSILDKNEVYLKKINPGVDLGVLYDTLFKPILDDEIDGDSLTNIDLLMDDPLLDERLIINHPSLVLFAYCNQAMKAQEKGGIDAAWKFLIEASFWLGMAGATSVMPAIQEVVAKNARSENAKK